MYAKLRFAILFLLLSPAGHASHEKLWENTFQFGGTVITGNSPETTVTGKITSEHNINYPNAPWGYNLLLIGRKSTAREVETARFLQTDAEGRYLFSQKTYSYAKLSNVYNAFDTYDIVLSDSVGLGRILIKDEIQRLTIEAGPGSTHQRIAGPETWQSQFIGHMEANYLRHLSQSAEFTQFLSADIGNLNAHYQGVTAVKTKVSSNVALRFSFEANHYTKIPANTTNTKRTDTATNVMIIYSM